MRKILGIFILILCLVSCGDVTTKTEDVNSGTIKEKQTLGILTINDLHGAIEATDKQADIAMLAGEIRKQGAKFDDYILLAGGDMWQGTALSNVNRGLLINNIMNELEFDGMVIGNHEFDWGVEEITKFKDGNSDNGEAEFPFLAANIFDNKGTPNKADDTLASFVEPYTIVEAAGWTVGVIGYIGSEQKNSITASYVERYDFYDPAYIVTSYAETLSETCDLIIAFGHDANEYNNHILTKSPYIDIVYNAHTHYYYVNKMNGKIVMQSGSNGADLGVTTVTPDKEISAENIYFKNFTVLDEYIDRMVEDYKSTCTELYGVINTSKYYVTRENGAYWASSTIKAYTGADFGMLNLGGIRSVGFPIKAGEEITPAKLYDIMPFDNEIWLVSMSGEKLLEILNNNGDYIMSFDFEVSSIDLNKTYTVACCDYIVDGSSDFEGLDIVKTDLLVRDAMIDDIKAQKDKGYEWSCYVVSVEKAF